MPRQFITGFLEETPETVERFRKLLDRTPSQEPANGGPSDEEFSDGLVVAATDLLASADMFPDPALTAALYQIKR
ncbi:hypothetical protein [Azospirillum thermophilum]|uniref:Uncharacterized protein n=1 Tax=Azospirillum thermophilum TaxID=2202148 RepID=A0A2S2CSK4_9PROT|nr:hypothetical protein [Azospirillum thermophilum]AWK87360.1 hypothetical protein DEW08_15060 [Azospirillum thermophilum]